MIVGISGLLIGEDGQPVGTAGAGKDTLADLLVSHASFTKVALADPLKRVVRDLYRFTDMQLWGPSHMRNEPDTRYPREHTWKVASLVERMRSTESFSCACCGQKVGKSYDGHPDAGAATQCYLTPRYALQILGTEGARHCYVDTWVNYATNIASDLLKVDSLGRAKWMYDVKQGLRAPFEEGDPTKNAGVAIPDVRFRNEVDGLRARGTTLIRVKRHAKGLANAAGMHPSERESTEIPDSAFDVVFENDGTVDDLRDRVRKWAGLLGTWNA